MEGDQMLKRVRNVVGATAIAAAVVVTPLAGASAAAAPDAQRQNGLVNVSLCNAGGGCVNHNNVGIGVAAQLAANVCGVAVGVLARQIAHGTPVHCQNAQGQTVDIPLTQ
jgi:hypothetical protein